MCHAACVVMRMMHSCMHSHTTHFSGVAPDHPDVKSVIHEFESILADPRVHFYGNVYVGKDVTVTSLRQHYHGVILAYGAESDRGLDIPGSQLKGIHPARTFVAWYNGHPDAAHLQFDLSHVEQVVVIGQGNVAVDVARMLLMPVETLSKTDATSYALQSLSKSHVTDVHLVGRRGPVQSAFTIKELREIATLSGVHVMMDERDLQDGMNPASVQELEVSHRKCTCVNGEPMSRLSCHLAYVQHVCMFHFHI